MTAAPHTLFVGVGSPHGDDQIGWQIADELMTLLPDRAAFSVRKAVLPVDIVDWLEGVTSLHVCDAFLGNGPVGALESWRLPQRQTVCSRELTDRAKPELHRLRASGSHDFGLPEVLELAARIGTLPFHVVIHAITGRRFQPGQEMSPELSAVVSTIVRRIRKELIDARDIPRTVASQTS